MTDLASEFSRRLQAFERDGDVDPLVELFADDAELSKLEHVDREKGREGARKFWTDYRNVFGSIASTFVSKTDDGQRVVLEWESEGTLSGGQPVKYAGVSVLEVEGDMVRRFRTYYDSAAFVPLS